MRLGRSARVIGIVVDMRRMLRLRSDASLSWRCRGVRWSSVRGAVEEAPHGTVEPVDISDIRQVVAAVEGQEARVGQ